MPYTFNQQFAYATFEEEAKLFDKPVRCLTFQDDNVYQILINEGVYCPELEMSRHNNEGWYKKVIQYLGFLPIWVFNPLQFGNEPQPTFDPDWFVDGTLWRRFLETCGLTEEIINKRLLLEIEVPSSDLRRDVTLDYGFISCIKELRKENLVAVYKLVYTDLEQETSDDWYYPTIYPSRNNDSRATFKSITNFRAPENLLSDIIDDILMDVPAYIYEESHNAVYRILEHVKLRKKRLTEDYTDDVRYAVYNHRECGWVPICVQDFDFKDYYTDRFLSSDVICGNIESDAVAIYRRTIHEFFSVSMDKADDLACDIATEICKIISSRNALNK